MLDNIHLLCYIVVMKMRVAYIARPYKDKVYSYPFLVTSYRDKNGVARNKTIMKLSNLPEHAVSALDAALRSGEDAQIVPVQAIKFCDAIPFGDIWAVFRLAENLRIIEAFSQPGFDTHFHDYSVILGGYKKSNIHFCTTF